MKRKTLVQRATSGLLLTLLSLIVLIPLTHADSIATIDMSENFIPTDNYHPRTLFVTGEIFCDIEANTVIGMDMTFLGSAGVSQFSMQGSGGCSGGGMFAECHYIGQSGTAASINLWTINFCPIDCAPLSGILPSFVVGASWGACATRNTSCHGPMVLRFI